MKQPNCYVICEGSPVNGRLEIIVFTPDDNNKMIPATYADIHEAIAQAKRFADRGKDDHVICPAILEGNNIEVWEDIEGHELPVYNGSIYDVNK